MTRPDQPASDDALFGFEADDCARSRPGTSEGVSRPEVLAMVDRVAAPYAVVVITGDGSLGTHESEWTAALRGLIQTYLGDDRRAGARSTYTGTDRSHEDGLADSAFSNMTAHHSPVSRAWTPEDVLGYLRPTSFARPAFLAVPHHEVEAAAVRLLRGYACGGFLKGHAGFTVLAHRPGGDA
ncbi:hypothetical protein [Streptomyces sp. NPDC127190]|uniref:hypothetical protein n=1 Tax=unclassified Streptomyces TaxID=2593676 RepID=UPI00363BE4C6